MMQVQCPRCSRSIPVDDHEIGWRFECIACGENFEVQWPDPPIDDLPARCLGCNARITNTLKCAWCSGEFCSERCLIRHNKTSGHDVMVKEQQIAAALPYNTIGAVCVFALLVCCCLGMSLIGMLGKTK